MCWAGAKPKSGQKRRGGAVRGANNGKLLPGEKKRLKREKINAKRAARSAAHGLDLESVNAELVQFVAADGDMKVGCCHSSSWQLVMTEGMSRTGPSACMLHSMGSAVL